ncbi:serine/threonine-protein kinase [Pseudonocardia sp. TRM90224]|uniref:serine/threonine-protein kinase n=1 Tax=Pseudonocardia sp. TRM90224 TaxID=2812678 RepID=UPI001E51410A|nr:serine/threonine-protein kinase [Pseudonocardia sp. TRM90224]
MSSTWIVPGFTELRELGRGGGGTVVLATDNTSGAPVAIKYLGDDLLADPGFRDAFRTEAQLLAELDTPHVVRLYEYVESPGGAAIVMEPVEGTSLRSILVEHGATKPESALSVLKGSLLGLQAAHGSGVVHRDYKPENVLVTVDGQSKLVDFGVATRSGAAGDGSGTPAYMPPEQWAGGPASPRGDIYSATATFVECITAQPPFPAKDMATLRGMHESAPVPVAMLPEAVHELARRGLAKVPAHRPADAGTFLVELERAALAGYGPDWEERGVDDLARRAALLALLLPAAAGAGAATGIGSTVLGAGGRGLRLTVLAGTAILVIIGGVVTAVITQGGVETTEASTALPAAVEPAPPVQIPPALVPVPAPEPVAPAPADTQQPAAVPPPAAQPPAAQPPAAQPPVQRAAPPQFTAPAVDDEPEPPAVDEDDGEDSGNQGGNDDDGSVDTPPSGNDDGDSGDNGDGGSDTPPDDDGDGGSDTPPSDGDGGDSGDGGDGGSDIPPSDGGDSDGGDSDSDSDGGLFPISISVDTDLSDEPDIDADLDFGSSGDESQGELLNLDVSLN